MIPGNPQCKITNDIKEIIRQRMSLKTASSLDNCPIIKTEIAIPRNSVVVDNTEIIGNEPCVGAVNNHEKQKDIGFSFCRWKNVFQEG